jgi:hypothetical protein
VKGAVVNEDRYLNATFGNGDFSCCLWLWERKIPLYQSICQQNGLGRISAVTIRVMKIELLKRCNAYLSVAGQAVKKKSVYMDSGQHGLS